MSNARHKSATEVAIVGPEEPSLLFLWVSRYWKLALGAFLAVAGAILFNQVRGKQAESHRQEMWTKVRLGFEAEAETSRSGPSPERIEEAVAQVRNTPMEPWALMGLVSALVSERKYPEALEALNRLKATHEPSLTEDRVRLSTDGEPRSLAEWMGEKIAAEQAWEAAHPSLFTNPPLPADAPRVRLVTSQGEIVLGLYPAEAPKHVENFLKLVREGFYAGTKFHRIAPGFMIQGGDPNSREANYDQWGLGGPGYNIESEKNSLYHFKGVLSAAKKNGEVESSGSQFFITTGEAHHLDGRHVVFGAVISGQEIADTISEGVIEDQATGRPEKPVELIRAEVIE